MLFSIYSAFQIDALHRHNQNLVGTLHKGVPTVFEGYENCCKDKSPYSRGFLAFALNHCMMTTDLYYSEHLTPNT
ncbi:MAG: hypothetical protein MGU50_03840 [Trichodesmium sp. MAG_R02]|nr:hypothetical protein [Trichodesmium sp. MAG_R02]